MKNHILVGALLLCGGALLSLPSTARAQTISIASESDLASISLPDGAMRFAAGDTPAEISDALQTLVEAGGPDIKRGRTEILGWAGNANRPAIKAQVGAALQRAGWQLEEAAGEAGMTLVSAIQTAPVRRGLLGFWVSTPNALMLAWTETRPASNAATPAPRPANTGPVTPSPEEVRANPAQTLDVDGGSGRHVVNVSKNTPAPRVNFDKLAPKPGFARGWVKNAAGQPLAGATIGVRSSAVGGAYSGASGKTDARGYYEIAVPWGAAEFYNAGYSADFYEGRAAFGLLPADGEASSFASATGGVENWVLPSFGIADPDEVADQPQFFGNYYGGSFSLSYFASDPRFGDDGGLPVGAEIDLSLFPVGPLFDGSKGRNLIFKQRVEDGIALGFTAVNIPVGQYRVVALLRHNGRTSPLQIEESGPNASKPFGLEPKKSRESAVLTFRPGSAKADKVAAGKSNWDALAISLKP